MSPLTRLWQFFTPTKALEMCNGYYERKFYDSLYRVTYLAGISTADKSVLYLLYSYTVKTLIVTLVFGEFWHLFKNISNLDSIIGNINATLIHVIAMYRYKVMLNHADTFRKLTQAMETGLFDVTTERRKELVEMWYQRSEIYLKLLLAIGTCTLAAWYVYPLVDDLEYNLVVPITIPFDYKGPVLYPIVYVVVTMAFHYTSYFVMANDLIIQVMLLHILCQFSVLADCFENIIEDCNKDSEKDNTYLSDKWKNKYLQRLESLVNQHKFITDNTMEFRKILSVPMLFQFAMSSVIICCVAYQVTETINVSITKFLMSVEYMAYTMFELFTFCRWCDEIRVQSENIRNAVYCSGWEGGASSLAGVRARLMLVMARASKPIVLSAGGLYDLSLESYTTVVKTSYTALTVLLRFQEDN